MEITVYYFSEQTHARGLSYFYSGYYAVVEDSGGTAGTASWGLPGVTLQAASGTSLNQGSRQLLEAQSNERVHAYHRPVLVMDTLSL